ncbi:MAG: DUF1080 domain-containing protein [Planctomycetes bacterium]|nr:DUF1080 domain-containing protein [Planctomycetota bacterium]
MRFCNLVFLSAIAVASLSSVSARAQEAKANEPKAVSIFDGKSLAGWSGLTANWRVEDGAITGENTAAAPISQNTFLVYEKPVKEFELELDFKIQGGNSGIQYRSKLLNKEKFVVGGYQADIDSGKRFMGINYEEQGRGILTDRGEINAIDKDGKKSKVGSAGDPEALLSRIKWEDWNHYRVVARGPLLQHYINDTLMSETRDEESAKAAAEGIIAFQVHAGPPMKVQFKNVQLRTY